MKAGRQFLGQLGKSVLGLLGMRRRFEIRVAFTATRLSAEHLRFVYETVTPIVGRSVTAKRSQERADDVSCAITPQRSRKQEAR